MSWQLLADWYDPFIHNRYDSIIKTGATKWLPLVPVNNSEVYGLYRAALQHNKHKQTILYQYAYELFIKSRGREILNSVLWNYSNGLTRPPEAS